MFGQIADEGAWDERRTFVWDWSVVYPSLLLLASEVTWALDRDDGCGSDIWTIVARADGSWIIL
jgi:hypothetical protein